MALKNSYKIDTNIFRCKTPKHTSNRVVTAQLFKLLFSKSIYHPGEWAIYAQTTKFNVDWGNMIQISIQDRRPCQLVKRFPQHQASRAGN